MREFFLIFIQVITMKLTRLMTVALMATIFSSCTSDGDNNTPGTKFARITEYPITAGSEENFHSNLVYNGAGNVTAYNEASDPGVPVFDLDFEYAGSDNKPVRATYDIARHFFKYNASGKLIQDSILVYDDTPTVPTDYTEIKNISYPSSTLIVVNMTRTHDNGDIDQTIDSLTVDSRGNITQSKFHIPKTGGGFYLSAVYTRQFDDKPNPFGALNIFPMLQPGFQDIYFSMNNRPLLQKNNCTGSTNKYYDEDGNIWMTETITFTHTYDTDGRVRESTAITTGPGFSHRYVYDYE